VTQLAVGYGASGNGREQSSDGRHRHRGTSDTASLRVYGNSGMPLVGAGMEMLYAAPVATLQSFDRDLGAYRDLALLARNITLSPQGGALSLPAGSVTGPALAVGAVGGLQFVTFNPATANTTAYSWVAASNVIPLAESGLQLAILAIFTVRAPSPVRPRVAIRIDGGSTLEGSRYENTNSLYRPLPNIWLTGGLAAGSHTLEFGIQSFDNNAGAASDGGQALILKLKGA
jgi:hypothetical protein